MSDTKQLGRKYVFSGVARFGMVFAGIGILLIAGPHVIAAMISGDWSGAYIALAVVISIGAVAVIVPHFIKPYRKSLEDEYFEMEFNKMIQPQEGCGNRVKADIGMTVGRFAGYVFLIGGPAIVFMALAPYFMAGQQVAEGCSVAGAFAAFGAATIITTHWGERYYTVLSKTPYKDHTNIYRVRYDNGMIEEFVNP